MARINPDSAFVRVFFDMETSLAIKVQEYCQKNGITRKQFMHNATTALLGKKGKTK
jgi:hypothetical protein